MNPGEAWTAAYDAATPDMLARVATVLRINAPDAAQLTYILRPFAPYNDGKKWWLAAIIDPCPVNVPELIGWEADAEIILIDMASGAMQTFDRDEGALIAPIDALARSGPVMLYTNGIVFARDWASARADWIDGIARETVSGCRAEPAAQPGVALCGDLARVADFSPLRASDRVVVDDPRMVPALNKALLRSANLPVVEAAPARLRVAA
jgi:hypothetical protein